MKTQSLILALTLAATVSVSAQTLIEQVPGELRQAPKVSLGVPTYTPKVIMDEQSQLARAPRHSVAADASIFDGRTVYGALINSTLWADYSITEVPYGVYSFAMGSDQAPTCHISDMGYSFKASAWGRDRLYGIVPLNMLGMLNGARNITIDTRNWREIKNVMYDTSYGTYSLIPCAMAYDPTDDTFYAFQYKEDLTGLNWVKVDIETDRYEQIAAYRGTTIVLTLAATPEGKIYYIDAAGDLYTINKTNGRTSLVGNTGVTPTPYDQSMVYDGRSGTFLWAAESTEGSVLYSVDPRTAETTRVMTFHNQEQFVGLYITDSEAPDAAPAAVGRPQMSYGADGSLDATITFTMPSRTYSGSTLSGDVNVNVWLDGENLKGVPAEPGTRITIPVTLSEGNHYVCITADNEAGFSPIRYIYQYAGYDTPTAPTDVTFAIEDGVNKLEWRAPAGGVNDGYVDFANITYDVVLMPGEVTVATGLKACSYSETTPSNMQSYYYRVYAVNNDHRSAYGESNHILCGDSFTVPYCQTFDDPATFADFFTAYDIDGDGYTWHQGYTTEVRNDYFHDRDADDWLITPAIKMLSGIKYRYRMNMKSFTPDYPEDFEILIGTDPADVSTFTLVKREEAFTEIASEFGDYTCDFLVPADGDYHMAVRYCSTKESKSSLIMIRSIGVEIVGNALAPAKVEDLQITPDADGALTATISFVAPTLDLQGGTLAEMRSIEVRRTDTSDLVHVFHSPTPGEQLSCTDETVPALGLYTYTVTPLNGEGPGETIAIEDFIGIYTAPYSTDFDDPKYAALWTQQCELDDDPNHWYGWSWTDNPNTHGTHYNLYYYLMEDKPTDIWLFTPKFKLEENTVYTVNYDLLANYSYYPDMEWSLHLGTAANSGAMATKIGDIPSTGYFMENREHYFVNPTAGQYFIGYESYGATKYDYFNCSLDNFSLTRRASAFAPLEITDYKSKADQSGELKATLQFKAPAVNYYKQQLDADEELTVKVYQGRNATMPKYTTKVQPGASVTWVDEEALHGFNYYMVTCENQYGRGEVLLDTLFVGRDVPELVEGCTFRATPDNDNVRIEWQCPSVGRNGGIVLPDEVKYNIYSYDRANDQLTPIQLGVTGNSYTVEANYTGEQQQYYYAIAAENTEGEGYALASSVVLGKLYTLPFAESFANTMMSTTLWQMIPMIEQATAWGTDNPSGSYNGCTGAQDDDGGCLYMYNGAQYETYIGALLVSPKVRISAERGNELRFWTYNFRENYGTNAYVQVAVSADDTNAEVLKSVEVGGRIERGWTEHVISLDRYRGSNFLSIVLLGITGGYQDVIYLDNITISNPNAEGITSVTVDTDVQQPIYDLRGIEVKSPTLSGVYIQGDRKVIIR